MIKLEKVFSKTTLEQLALQCYKYQLFSSGAALSKMNYEPYTPKTVKVYLDHTKQYLTHGTKNDRLNSMLYTLLDSFKASNVEILTPAKNEKYYPRKSKKSPILKIHPQANKFIKEIQQINYPQYGVKHENTIKIFDSKEFCLGYKECFKVFNKDQKAELVTVRYELVEEN